MTDTRVMAIADVETVHLFDMVVDLAPQLSFGGGRVLFGATGGVFEGPRLRGTVLAGGGDWAVFRPDGTMVLDVRLALRTHDGALVHMTYSGRWVVPADLRGELADPATRHRVSPERYYFRTNPLFETGADEYAWVNDIVCVGSGYLVDGGVAYKVSQVL
jgi:uncharacterized protein DUF3237